MGIIIGHPVEKTSKTILVPYESYAYLEDIERFQRYGDHRTEKQVQRLKEAFENDSPRYGVDNHKKKIRDYDMGGAVGAPENSWEEHRWTNWSVDTVKKMLDEAGLPYEEGPEVRYCMA